jgi:uncharacterized integral membrane protein (TIGR00698 family)
MIKRIAKYIGILIPIGIALIGFAVAKLSGINVILGSLILGIVFGNIFKFPQKYEPGIKKASGFVLELAIVFMAFSINYKSLLALGWELIVILIATVSFVIFITLFLAKKFKCPGSTGWLVGFGTAICGSSAIASLAPLVTKDKNDVGLALAVVNILGLLGMIVLPYAGKYWLNDMDLATIIGASLHSAGNVAGAGFVVNETVGELAITVKMGRIALLTPALFVFQWFVGKQQTEVKTSFKLPWYLISFIVISIMVSLVPMNQMILDLSKFIATALLAIAMAAIGLKMNLAQITKAGRKGLMFGVVIFVLQLAFIAILLGLF